jgi:hypothetical protein
MGVLIFFAILLGFSVHVYMKRKGQRLMIENRHTLQIKSQQDAAFNQLVSNQYTLFENLQYLKTTRRLDLAEERLRLVRSRLQVVAEFENWNLYGEALKTAENWYESNYIGCRVESDERAVVSEPKKYLDFSKWQSFETFVRLETLRRFVEHQLFDIEDLKTKRGQENRLKKIQSEISAFQLEHPNLRNHFAMVEIEKVVEWRKNNLK